MIFSLYHFSSSSSFSSSFRCHGLTRLFLSVFARQQKLPRIYLAANSGARIGLAEEIKHLFRIAWEDPKDPDKGFKYIYLSPEDFKKVSAANSVRAELIEDQGGRG